MAVGAPAAISALDGQASYGRDVQEWTREQVEILRARRWEALDLDHLIEELEDMGESRREAFESALIRVIEHLLKLQFSPRPEPRRGWMLSVTTHRVHARRRLKRSPSLAARIDLADLYRDGRLLAARSFALYGDNDPSVLPASCPYSIDQVLDDTWWPEGQAPWAG